MFAAILESSPQPALDAIHQDLQKIVSELQHPPGTQEWIKTVLTLLVGGALGFCASLALEFVRPWIQRILTGKRIAPKINREFEENMQAIHAALRMMNLSESAGEPERTDIFQTVSNLCQLIGRTTFDLYMDKEKEAVIDLKGSSSLIAFYSQLGNRYRDFVRSDEVVGATALMTFAVVAGENYVRASGLHFEARPHTFETVYKFNLEMEQKRRKKDDSAD